MEIPARLDVVLKADSRLHSAVSLALQRFTPWVDQKRLTFFDEYTDHGPVHIETVLRSATGLIAPAAWGRPDDSSLVGSAARTRNLEAAVGARDAGALVLAVLLHDSAMHLTEEGFLRLINREQPWPIPDSEFMTAGSEEPWPDLWDGFLQQCRRYDEQQLEAMFGNARPVTRPDPEPDSWTGLERKWIGEFIRRHHARLAHEIALLGVPGPTDAKRITLPDADDLEPWMCDVAGLIARSHNMDLRAAVELLPREDRKNFRGVHVPFLMAVLRIADYVDMDAPRAPGDVLKVRSIRSPISKAEWEKHRATVFVKTAEDDPECLRIDARPEDVHTFLALRSLYAGIQEQLDQSWAVLGEIYGGDAAFALRIRRVRSSLDQPSKLRLGFVPVEARLRTTGAGLLRHLVGPLYNDQAAYGVRELVQNAVDACRELDDIRGHGGVVTGSAPSLEADVVVTVDEEPDGTGWIVVEDRGVGMTPEVVRDYFLVAGASFRDSDAWHGAHADPGGKPRFARAGRFGIGAVAAFLLGDTVEVTTRDVLQPDARGIRFSCRIQSPLIEMRWLARPHGTTVRIRVTDPRVFDQLADAESWDWYRMKTPSLVRRMRLQQGDGQNRRAVLKRSAEHPPTPIPLGTTVSVPSMETLPARSGELPTSWRRLNLADSSTDVMWTFRATYPVTADDACDGFVLRRPDAWRVGFDRLWPANRNERDKTFYLYRPRLSIFDPDKSVPLDLRRIAISRLPFERELTEAVCREVLATLIVLTETTRHDVFRQLAASFYRPDAQSALPSLYHPAISSSPDEHRTKLPGAHSVSWLVLGPKGLKPATISPGSENAIAFVFGDLNRDRPAGPFYGQSFDLVPQDMQVRAVGGDPTSFFRAKAREAAVALLTPSRRSIRDLEPRLPENVAHRDAGNGWTWAWSGSEAESLFSRLSLPPAQPEDGSVVFVPRATVTADTLDPLTALWLDLLGPVEIPLDRAERSLVLARAFRELAPEIARLQGAASTY